METTTVTMIEMCQEIADRFGAVHNRRVTPEQIFEISPTGEMWPVYGLYEMYVRRSGYDVLLVPYVKRLLELGAVILPEPVAASEDVA